MADVFEFDPTGELDHQRERLWSLIEATPWLDWLLLTKRPEQISQMLPRIWLLSPRKNVWLGTSVENQAAADLRIPRLLAVPAVVHWLSCEPLLGPVDLTRIRTLDVLRGAGPDGADVTVNAQHNTLTGAWFDGWDRGVRDRRIAWVIVGGESGPNYRPMDLDWARSLRDQCQLAGAAFFYKQGASRLPGRDTELDGWTWHEWPAVTA
jgi:protein gp37